MGTLKDISLFGSFTFPLEGEHAGGLVARSLAAVGKELKRTKQQLQALSGRTSPLAGATGATIQQESTPVARVQSQPREPAATYSIQFVQHAAEPLITANRVRVEQYPQSEKQPLPGFTLKKGSGKRVTFTLVQKEVMIEFYERQATQGIRANPKDAIEVMRQRGIEPLKETQIRSWWSSYHQKMKNAVNNLAEEVNMISTSRSEQNHAAVQPRENVLDEPIGEESNLNVSPQPISGGPQQPTCNAPSSTGTSNHEGPQQLSIVSGNSSEGNEHSSPNLPGKTSIHAPCVIEWQFPVELSQSTIYGRMGSNACTFIALSFGHLYFSCYLQPPVNLQLQKNWKVSLTEAILSGNEIHDDIFDCEAINVAVDEAIQVAGDECFVDKIEQQYDIIGLNRLDQLKAVFERLAVTKLHSCHIIVTGGRSMLFIINQNGSTMIVDSHQHKATGAIIA